MTVNKVRYWALRERGTNLYLPDMKVKTRAEFTDGGVPRLFTSQQAASSALNCWRMGHWRHEIDSYGESNGPQPPDPSKKWNAETIAARKDVEVDIVPMRLVAA